VFSTGHLTSGIAVGLLLGLRGDALGVFVAASVLTDWDYVFQLLTGRNHRTLVTHSPPVYVVALGAAGFWDHLAWVALAGSLLHFSLDVWEYGLRLNPFRNAIFGARLIPGIERMGFREYVTTYFHDRRFLAAEIAFAALAGVLLVARSAVA
jgi:hypothetical protein